MKVNLKGFKVEHQGITITTDTVEVEGTLSDVMSLIKSFKESKSAKQEESKQDPKIPAF